MLQQRSLIRSLVLCLATTSLVATGSLVATADPKTVLLAGDIAYGTADSREAETADLVKSRSGLVITAGDNAYPAGTYQEFRDYYRPTWGRFLGRTRPTPGNHDYRTPGAAGYFKYFGRRAGPAGRGYYSFKAGSWRVFGLDSEVCKTSTGCGPGSPQFKWLKKKLTGSRERCTLAIWHTPRFSSGQHGDDPRVGPLLRLLYKNGAEVVVNGHEHDYERMAPARHTGTVDRKYGIRQFIVGTGGAPLRAKGTTAAPHSRVFQADTWGVLQLKLRWNSYNWRFLPIEGQSFEDSGKGRCHGKPK